MTLVLAPGKPGMRVGCLTIESGERAMCARHVIVRASGRSSNRKPER
jgi:hypothetical protein